jgi:hypothetical protein
MAMRGVKLPLRHGLWQDPRLAFIKTCVQAGSTKFGMSWQKSAGFEAKSACYEAKSACYEAKSAGLAEFGRFVKIRQVLRQNSAGLAKSAGLVKIRRVWCLHANPACPFIPNMPAGTSLPTGKS